VPTPNVGEPVEVAGVDLEKQLAYFRSVSEALKPTEPAAFSQEALAHAVELAWAEGARARAREIARRLVEAGVMSEEAAVRVAGLSSEDWQGLT
jgi:hypothetical protein